jgi:DNA polymerase-3 subunit alpha
VALSVDGEQLPYTVIDDLKHILSRFPGPCSVEMHVKHGALSRKLRLGDGYRVDPQTSLFAELKALLGDTCVCQGVPTNGAGNGAGIGIMNGAGNGAGR